MKTDSFTALRSPGKVEIPVALHFMPFQGAHGSTSFCRKVVTVDWILELPAKTCNGQIEAESCAKCWFFSLGFNSFFSSCSPKMIWNCGTPLAHPSVITNTKSRRETLNSPPRSRGHPFKDLGHWLWKLGCGRFLGYVILINSSLSCCKIINSFKADFPPVSTLASFPCLKCSDYTQASTQVETVGGG